ncbi:MAG: hypothetical protein Q9224_007752, partial [Gallowayella concinna]
ADPILERDKATGHALQKRDDEPTELYVIYPKDVTIKSQADAINELLDQQVSNKTAIYASEFNDNNIWTLFWDAPLTEAQAEKVKKDPNVGFIGKSAENDYDPTLDFKVDTTHTMQKREEGLRRQRHADEEMRFLSQPIDLDIANFETYVYDGSDGR